MDPIKVVTNRKARRDYDIFLTIEAGIELKGTEVKSLRDKQANLNDSFGIVERGELFLYNLHIAPYKFGNINNPDPLRPKKLLVKKNQIAELYTQTRAKGNAIIPLEVYFKNGLAKVVIGVGRGKKKYDKREDVKKREAGIEMKRALRGSK